MVSLYSPAVASILVPKPLTLNPKSLRTARQLRAFEIWKNPKGLGFGV